MTPVLKEFSDLLRRYGEILGETTLIKHDIVLDDDRPVNMRPRPIPYHLRSQVSDQLTKMLALGIVKESSSPWSSPILLVPKANGKYRFCIDFRKLNEKTRKDSTPMPRIDEVFAEIGKARVFSSLDLLSGFWQVPMSKDAQKYTAFSVGNRHYEFTKMAFGLSGGPGTFARLMRKVLDGLHNVTVYGDDVLIYSCSEVDHCEHVKSVLQRIRQAVLILNAEKCHFGRKEVTFLGHRITEGRIMPLPEKVACVQSFPRPQSKKQLQSFIGFAGFYRRFVPHFSSIMAPLYRLTKGDVSWCWGDSEEAAFNKIKQCLCDHPVMLHLPDVMESFEVSTDASEVGLGAVLSQQGRVIEYASRKLNAAERNYSITERELLAVVWALEKWRQYLFAQSFSVYTDHRPITFLKSIRNPKGRIARSITRLQEYDFKLLYRRGSDNQVADCLSRIPEAVGRSELLEHEVLPPPMEVVSVLLFHEDLEALRDHQREDPELKAVIEAKLQAKDLVSQDPLFKRYRQIWHQLAFSDEGVLMRNFRHRNISLQVPVMPAGYRKALLVESHGTAHMGVEKTYDLLRCNAYWPGLQVDVQKFVTSCDRCQLHKPVGKRNKAPMQRIFTSRPMEVWAMDIVGSLACTAFAFRYILVATDLFSKWVETVPLINQTAESVAKAFVQNVVLRHGPPKTLLTDQGTNFESCLMQEVCRLLGTRKIRTSPFHPRTDGQTERTNRTIKEWVASSGGDWEKQLPYVTYGINCAPNAATRLSPFQVVFGRQPSLFEHTRVDSPFDSVSDYAKEFRRNMRLFHQMAGSSAEESKRNFAEKYNAANCRTGWSPYNVGSQVKYRNHYPYRCNRKFSARFRGPFTVKSRRGVNYQISDGHRWTRWVHHDEIFPWRGREDEKRWSGRDVGAPSHTPRDRTGRDVQSFECSDTSSESESSCASDSEAPLPRRSTRRRRPPVWLTDYEV